VVITLVDEEQTKEEIAELYDFRRHIELDIRSFKDTPVLVYYLIKKMLCKGGMIF